MRINPQRIMCAVDFSDFTGRILSYGKSMAEEFGSKLYVCHVIQEAPMVSSHMAPYLVYAGMESERIAYVKENLQRLARDMGLDCELLISNGQPADEIDRLARENDIDMVVAATYGGSGIKRFLIGSVTNRLVKILSCPLLVLNGQVDGETVPATAGFKLERILVGCDFSPDSQLAFDYALSLAQEFETQLHLAHVMRSPEYMELGAMDYIKIQEADTPNWSRTDYLDMQKKAENIASEKQATLVSRLERQLADMVPEESRHWCTPATVLLEGQPYKELLAYAEKEYMDMVVLGVRGHGLLEQFIVGSTTERVISRAPCPVLAVRHQA